MLKTQSLVLVMIISFSSYELLARGARVGVKRAAKIRQTQTQKKYRKHLNRLSKKFSNLRFYLFNRSEYKKKKKQEKLLFEAAHKSDTKAIRELLRSGVNVNAIKASSRYSYSYKWTVLHWAVFAPKGPKVVVAVRELLGANGINVNARDGRGQTPLHKAVKWSGVNVVKELLGANGINVNARDKDRRQPLHLAARGGKVEVIGELLDAGSNVNAKDKNKWTPLHWAVYRGEEGAIRELLSVNGIRVHAKTKKGKTALDFIMEKEILSPSLKEIEQQILEMY